MALGREISIIGKGGPSVYKAGPRGSNIDPQAQAHYDRVIADGGSIPSGLNGVNNFFTTVKGIYGTSDITTAISVGLDAQVLGYKLGAGTGTTAGQAAQKLYSCSGSSGDVIQTTAASQPLLLVHSGVNYYFQSGVAGGNQISTPNAAANNITGDIDIMWNYTPNSISTISRVIYKFNGSNFSYQVYQWSSQRLFFETQYGSVISTNHGITSGTNVWFRVTRQASNGEIKFYKSLDAANTTPTSVLWTLFDTNTTMTAGNLSTGGDLVGFDADPQVAKYYRITISNSIGGAPVVDFNPATYNAATSQTQWTSTTGEVWTINTGTASTGYKGVLVDRTEVQGDGIDDKLTASGLSGITLNTRISALNPINLSGGYIIQGRQSGTGDKHLWYQTGGNIQAYSNAGGSINFGGISSNSLKVLSTDFNNASSNCLTNNANQVNGTLNSDTFTDLDIFGGTASFKNCIINTLIETSSVSTPTQKTAMYNYIISINNL